MPNEALERLMACLLASIAKKKKKKKWKKRELLLLSLHPLNKLKHTDTEQVKKKKNTVHGGRQDARVSLWNSQFCQASVGGKENAEGTVGVGAERWKPQT